MGRLSEQVRERLDEVRARIARAGGDASAVTIVAVTKGFGDDEVAAAIDVGLVDVGENYAQELAAKAAVAPSPARWHFLGGIQTNKVRAIAPLVHLWHGVDRVEEAEAIARYAPGARLLVQVNASGEAQKGGCDPEAVEGLVERCHELALDVRGLMTVGPAGDLVGSAVAFRAVAGLAGRLGLPELSMGMTDDLEIAVSEGATIVRIGRALFGPRVRAGGVRR